jgi:polyisoprenoid-binding protein YceI
MKLLLPSLALIFTSSAFAAPEIFYLDANHTYPRFSYTHMGYSTQLSRFDKTTGVVVLDSEAKTGSVDVTIDMTSVDTGSALNEHIQGKDFLDTAAYPTATFKSTSVKFDGDTPVAVNGNLTIKGVTKPVTLTVTSFDLPWSSVPISTWANMPPWSVMKWPSPSPSKPKPNNQGERP